MELPATNVGLVGQAGPPRAGDLSARGRGAGLGVGQVVGPDAPPRSRSVSLWEELAARRDGNRTSGSRAALGEAGVEGVQELFLGGELPAKKSMSSTRKASTVAEAFAEAAQLAESMDCTKRL